MKSADYLLPPILQEPLRKLVGKDLVPSWMNQAWFLSHGVEPRSVDQCDDIEVLRESLCRDLTENSLPKLLRYEDRNSMAFSIVLIILGLLSLVTCKSWFFSFSFNQVIPCNYGSMMSEYLSELVNIAPFSVDTLSDGNF